MCNTDVKIRKKQKVQSSLIFTSLCVCWRSKHFASVFKMEIKTLSFWVALKVFPLTSCVLIREFKKTTTATGTVAEQKIY